MADNRRFEFTGELDEFPTLEAALKLAFDDAKSWGYAVITPAAPVGSTKTLVFLSWQQTGGHPFTTRLGPESCACVAREWLAEHWQTAPPPTPTHDGSNGVGYRIYLEHWNKVGPYHAVCGIEPYWLWYGK